MEEIIGVVDLRTPKDLLINEALGKVNIGKDAKICDVIVKGREGQIPHFHIENQKGYICCVCLLEPLYFTHKNEESKLNADQKAIIDMFMSEKNKKFPDKTNWEVAYQTWIDKNDYSGANTSRFIERRKVKLDKETQKPTKPDYTSLDNGPKGTIHAAK